MIQTIRDIASQLEAAYPKDEALVLAWWIAEETTGLSRSQMLCDCKSTKKIPNVQIIIDRLMHFEPIQYIFGHTEWCGLDLQLTPATLIPRPETAELVETIINHKSEIINHQSEIRVLDIGTGSGCIAIALKKAHADWQVTGIDISPEAIEVAKENARRNHVEVDFYVADIFDTNEENLQSSIFNLQYDIVVSNPPYICNKEKASMRPNVLDYEPATALFVPDDDPLLFYRRIAQLFSLPFSMKGVALLFFEINEAYAEEVSDLLAGLHYTDIQITRDMYGKPRIIQARSPR